MLHQYFLAGLLLVNATCNPKSSPSTFHAGADTTFTNPLLAGGPDPWVEQKDSTYYYMNTSGNGISLCATNRMSELNKGVFTTIWTPPATGMYSKEIWAPEIHYLQNKWYVYFAADDGDNDHHRIYALECADADPVHGSWIFRGKVADTLADTWAIDASVFTYNGQLYMVWSGWPGAVNTEQDLFIARMKDPLTFDGPRVMIASPRYDWEKTGAPPAVNEGPEALVHDGRLFLTYSASGCWTDSYALGLLTLRQGGDPLVPADWSKTLTPVFSTVPGNGAYAPGHNGFFRSRDGREDWIIYHANTRAGQGCGDARNPRMQPFSWNADGSPHFGQPVHIGTPLRRPGGE